MRVVKVFIPHRLDGLNDYIKAMNKHWSAGNDMKKINTEIAAFYFKRLLPLETPVSIRFDFFEPNAKRDPDNIISAKKFILDGMQVRGANGVKFLPNDNQKWIKHIEDSWSVVTRSDEVGVLVTIKEWEENKNDVGSDS